MKRTAFLLIFILFIFSCREKNKVDVVSPVIGTVTVDGVDSSVFELTAGENITLSINVNDDMGLNQILYSIHPADDGHLHDGNGYIGGEDHLNSGFWLRDEMANLSGTSSVQTFEIEVPDSVAGQWHLTIDLIDDVGNASVQYIALIRVLNDNLPVIEVTTVPGVDANGVVNMTEGEVLYVSGQAADFDGLSEFFVYVNNWAEEATDSTFITIAGSQTLQSFQNLTYDQPASGEYRLVVEARDSLGYLRRWDAKIMVND